MPDKATLEEIEKIAIPYIPQQCSYGINQKEFKLYKKTFIIYLALTGCYHPRTKTLYRPVNFNNRVFL